MKYPVRMQSIPKRGAVIILVITILAVLGLLGATMTFTSRVDLASARNVSNLIQARMATVTGIPLFGGTGDPGEMNLLPQRSAGSSVRNGIFEPLEPVSVGLHVTELKSRFSFGPTPISAVSRNTANGRTVITKKPRIHESLTSLYIEDTSAKINLNAIIPSTQGTPSTAGTNITSNSKRRPPQPAQVTEAVLAKLIADVARKNLIPGINAEIMARHIVMRRFGPDQRPGTASFDDNMNGRQARTADPVTLTPHPQYRRHQNTLRPYPGSVEGRSIRSDQVDNDRDGEVDERDESILDDGLDNDADGQIDEAGEDIDDWAECISDVRRSPNGDDRFYATTQELLGIPGMTPQLYNALEPYLTVFSVSCSAFLPESSQISGTDTVAGWPMVDPNTAPPELIYQVLKMRFPRAPENLIGQFTANLVDRRDKDDIPRQIDLDGASFRGIEVTPCINEVCPDVSSFDEEGDDGQYIELFNPWNQSFSLGGWILKGAGEPVRLYGSIPSKGYLVVTDDYNNDQDLSPEEGPEQGSFYAIFGKVPTGNHRRLVEFPNMEIPNEHGKISLLNPDGEIVDTFSWENGRWLGAQMSFQRLDPKLRSSRRELATPLGPNHDFAQSAQATKNLQIQEEHQNTAFHSALDVMLVSSAYINDRESQDTTHQSWRLPVLNAQDSTELDIRLIDCFRVGAHITPRDRYRDMKNQRHQQAGFRTPHQYQGVEISRFGIAPQSVRPIYPPRVSMEFGLLNINLVPLEILEILPGMDKTLSQRIEYVRMHPFSDTYRQTAGPIDQRTGGNRNFNPNMASTSWKNLSDFIIDERIWGNRPLYDRLDTVYPYLRMLTTHSQAYKLVTINRPPVSGDESGRDVNVSQVAAERIITADRGDAETIQFRFLHQRNNLIGDPDMLYSSPESEAGKVIYIADLLFDNPLKNAELDLYSLSPGMQAVFHPENHKF